MNTDRTFTEALVLIDEHNGRPEEHVHAGNRLAATSPINKALRDGVPSYKIAVFAKRGKAFFPVRWSSEVRRPMPVYDITFEEVGS